MAPAECGHGAEVSAGQCWDCHLANLRATGQGARADRLVIAKRQHDEGRFDLAALVAALAEQYVRGNQPGPPGPAAKMRRGRP